MDVCIDGRLETGTSKAIMKVDASWAVPTQDGGKAKLTLSTQSNITTTKKELPKK
jgi:hypothetical protein